MKHEMRKSIAALVFGALLGVPACVMGAEAAIEAQQTPAADNGIAFGFLYRADVFSNVSGGLKQGTTALGNLDVTLDSDLDTLIGWDGVSVGLHVGYLPTPETYVQTVALDSVPGDPDNPRGTHIQFNDGDGALRVVEVGYIPGKAQGVAGRSEDLFAVSFTTAHARGKHRLAASIAGAEAASHESVWEATCRAQITPWLIV